MHGTSVLKVVNDIAKRGVALVGNAINFIQQMKKKTVFIVVSQAASK